MRPSSPVVRRLRPPSWFAPRLVAGVLLVVVSMVAGAKIIAAADRSVLVWALDRDVAVGTVLTAEDVRPARVRLFDSAPRYLRTTRPPTGRAVSRRLGEGELLPIAALLTRRPACWSTSRSRRRTRRPSPAASRSTSGPVARTAPRGGCSRPRPCRRCATHGAGALAGSSGPFRSWCGSARPTPSGCWLRWVPEATIRLVLLDGGPGCSGHRQPMRPCRRPGPGRGWRPLMSLPGAHRRHRRGVGGGPGRPARTGPTTASRSYAAASTWRSCSRPRRRAPPGPRCSRQTCAGWTGTRSGGSRAPVSPRWVSSTRGTARRRAPAAPARRAPGAARRRRCRGDRPGRRAVAVEELAGAGHVSPAARGGAAAAAARRARRRRHRAAAGSWRCGVRPGRPGRTTVAVGLADETARLGVSTLLVDADVYGGTVAQFVGLLDESAGLAVGCRAAGARPLRRRDAGRAELAAAADAPGAHRTGSRRPLAGVATRARSLAVLEQARHLAAADRRRLRLLPGAGRGAGVRHRGSAAERRHPGRARSRRHRACAWAAPTRWACGGWSRDSTSCARPCPGASAARRGQQASGRPSCPASRAGQIDAALRRWAGVPDAVFLPPAPAVVDAAMRTGGTLAEAAPDSPLRRALTDLARRLAGVPTPAPAGAAGSRGAAEPPLLRSSVRRRLAEPPRSGHRASPAPGPPVAPTATRASGRRVHLRRGDAAAGTSRRLRRGAHQPARGGDRRLAAGRRHRPRALRPADAPLAGTDAERNAVHDLETGRISVADFELRLAAELAREDGASASGRPRPGCWPGCSPASDRSQT